MIEIFKRSTKNDHNGNSNHLLTRLLFLLMLFLCLFIGSTTAWTATLLEAKWDKGTGCSCTSLNSGIWTTCTDGACEELSVASGGIGNRNYLKISIPASNITNHLRASNPSLGNPSTAYVRFWFKKNFNCGAMHPLYISSGTSVDSGFGAWRDWPGSFSIIPNVYSTDVYYYNGNITNGAWYMLEYKITGGGTSKGTITVRLNGVDITSKMISDSSGRTLSADNGGFSLQSVNYVNWEVYYGQCTGKSGDWLDIAGLKITDGPDWIGALDPPSDFRKITE